MKVIIAGTRTLDDPLLVDSAVYLSRYNISEVISGGCKGIDQWGEVWAKKQGIPIKIFQADWDKYGRAAGPIRNALMAEYANALILIWDGKSKGSLNMLCNANKLGLKICNLNLGD